MSRQTVKEAELVIMINHRFSVSDEVDGDCREVKIHGVQRYPEPGPDGCNWDIQVFNGPGVCGPVFRSITNRTVEERFSGPDLARIRIIKTWRYAIGRSAAEREAEILRQYEGDKYCGPDILLSGGNTELFTHDILGLDRQDKKNI